MAPDMRKTRIFATLAACLGLSACQWFTAGEAVSEPNLAHAQATHPESGHAKPHGAPGTEAPGEQDEPKPPETATASHILIRYLGARRAPSSVTRSQAEAKTLAEQIAAKARTPGADFVELANQYTEDPSGKSRGGRLGTFGRGRMVPAFDKATFELEAGEVSGVVETDFGYHIIYREK